MVGRVTETARAWAAGALAALVLTLFAAPASAQSGADALDALVQGKPALERNIPVRVDVVGYDLKANPKAAAQLKAVSQAGGGGYSQAGVQDIGQVMQGLVKGQGGAQKPTSGQVEYGETLIRHGAVK